MFAPLHAHGKREVWHLFSLYCTTHWIAQRKHYRLRDITLAFLCSGSFGVDTYGLANQRGVICSYIYQFQYF